MSAPGRPHMTDVVLVGIVIGLGLGGTLALSGLWRVTAGISLLIGLVLLLRMVWTMTR